ncbi:DEDD exonuclease domain-containing protein [Mobilicoccus pelagius]|uniref:DNA polymerase III epsilon subunit n=1 Tax=Mobilicoccus pelagius NBRC 104925 TaxID=1089455 RepID=H5UUT4_9MICO|nr:DEDD exonuclease domain-containing protein [Mobilicoccus pelagius]GAB49492.1 DNA polymerase III epsilon subunit [Mobilicoccus pelagius NBRC 104925]
MHDDPAVPPPSDPAPVPVHTPTPASGPATGSGTETGAGSGVGAGASAGSRVAGLHGGAVLGAFVPQDGGREGHGGAALEEQIVQGPPEVLGTPLSEVTFVVVDLETTGGSPADSSITEIGAVKVNGGEVVEEFHTLVDPQVPVPPFIRLLTGITDEMLEGAPHIDEVLPSFLEFSRGAVLVAHNAPFDIGFLRAATRACGLSWPAPAVVDTVTLARRLVTRDEVPNHKLGTLAELFGTAVAPDHRALHDARATVDVLHGLLARCGSSGPLAARTLEDLQVLASRVHPVQRRKRHLAEGLPSAPGVYMFTGVRGQVLYVGTSTDIRRRVASYFTAAEQRARMTEMLTAAEHVVPVVCTTRLEAQVREIRLIAEHDPPYNRQSRRPWSRSWIKVTVEPFPRLSVVTRVKDDGAWYAGPFARKQSAVDAVAAVHEVLPLRQCTTRLARLSSAASPCLLAEIGRCGAPCLGRQSVEEYAPVASRAHRLFAGADRSLLDALRSRMRELAAEERFEEADAVRRRTAALTDGLGRVQRLAPLAEAPEIVAARRRDGGGWEVVSVRHGRLAGTTLTPPGTDPMPSISAMRAAAEVVAPPVAPSPATTPEETEILHRWLTTEGVRLVDLVGTWSCPVGGADGAPSLRSAEAPGGEDGERNGGTDPHRDDRTPGAPTALTTRVAP